MSPFAKSFTHVAAPLREFGTALGCFYVLDRIFRGMRLPLRLHGYEFVRQPVDDKPLLPLPLTKNLDFQLLSPGHPDLLRMPVPVGVPAERLASGARCCAAYRRGELLGYAWWCSQRYLEGEVRCAFTLDDHPAKVFDFDLHVLPAHRMGVGFLAVWEGARRAMRAEGVTATYSRISLFNTASRRAHARLGALRVGRAYFVGLGSLVIILSDLAPCLAVALGRRRPALLKIDGTPGR
jgi:Acetyltransferase (GNAT) family